LPAAITANAALPEHWLRPAQAQAILERGLRRNPDSALLHGWRAESLALVGRNNEAVDEALKAMQLNPLSPSNRTRYISALVYDGRTAKAFDELRKAEAIWPGSAVLRQARYRLHLRYGDPKIALQILHERGSGDARPIDEDIAWQAFIEARINPNGANIEKALDAFRKRAVTGDWGYLQALATFQKVDEAFQMMEAPDAIDGLSATTDAFFRVHMRPILRDARFIGVADRIGLLAYWRQTGIWPDFCRDPELSYNCQAEAAKYPTQPALTRLGNGN
jgi:tetratricopeptide (TPR) repeat protein